MTLTSGSAIRVALTAVGEQLAFQSARVGIVVVGGAALNLLGIVERSTSDVDVIAFGAAASRGAEPTIHQPPDPMPRALELAIATVARDLRLDPGWLNTEPALQWRQGLPLGLGSRVSWHHYGPRDAASVGLDVGLVSRLDLIFLKLYAAVDHATTRSVHYRDLLALSPTADELGMAAAWILPQNA